MAAPSAPVNCFDHLLNHIPDWLALLKSLEDQIAQQQSRFAHLTQCLGVRLVRQKHGSTESLRPKDGDAGEGDDAAIVVNEISVPSGQSRPSTSNKDMNPKEIRRKRKPNSSWSATSGPQRYRTRSMIVVYYDSMIQEDFEKMVRNIAAARNQLRKGKMAVSFKARMASLEMKDSPFSATDEIAVLGPKVKRPPVPRSMQTNLDVSSSGPIRAFEEADNDLEVAQNLCEVAAHQFLRAGECDEEIQGARARLENCLRLARKERETWTQTEEEAEVEMEDSPRLEQRKVDMDEKVNVHVVKPVSHSGVAGIEVDDTSDTNSVHIDMSAFRQWKRI